jgi:hypothetical protein
MAFKHDDTSSAASPKQVGGWKLWFGALLAALGVGFAGYVYVLPYQKLTQVVKAQTDEMKEQLVGREQDAAERDKLKAELAQHESVVHDKAEANAKVREVAEALTIELKTALEAVGGVVTLHAPARVTASFPTSAIFESPFATGVAGQGETALKILAAAAKKTDFKVRVKARLIALPPPRELSQFKNIGEFAMLRAVRVALAIANAGVKAENVAATGAEPPDARKGTPAVPDHLEVEIEHE